MTEAEQELYEQQNAWITDETTPDQLIECGLGQLTRGLWRLHNQPGVTADDITSKGGSVTTVIREVYFDLARAVNRR